MFFNRTVQSYWRTCSSVAKSQFLCEPVHNFSWLHERCRFFIRIHALNNNRTFTSLTGNVSKELGRSKKPYHVYDQIYSQRRCFWGVDVAFNKVDEERVRLAGPDRAAAEWVLRNGGSIKWTTSSRQLKDYNLLPSTGFDAYKLEEIDLTGTDVIALGFEHLKDLHNLRKIKLHGVRTINDEALFHLVHVKDTLEVLEISKCPMITEKGLNQLHQLKKLKVLILYDLIETRNFDQAVANLKRNMPWMSLDTTDPSIQVGEKNDEQG